MREQLRRQCRIRAGAHIAPARAGDRPGVDAPAAHAQRRTENVVIITTDGLRWQELFRGAERALSYAVSGTVRHGRVIVLRSTADAGYLTTSIGRDYLVNRSVTFAAWMIVLLLLTAGAVRYHRFHRMRAANG